MTNFGIKEKKKIAQRFLLPFLNELPELYENFCVNTLGPSKDNFDSMLMLYLASEPSHDSRNVRDQRKKKSPSVFLSHF